MINIRRIKLLKICEFYRSYWNSKYAKFKYHQIERKQILGKCQCQKFMYIFFVWLNQSSFVKSFYAQKEHLRCFSYQKDVTEAIWSCITELTHIQRSMCLYFYTRTWYSLSIRPYSLNKWLHHLQYSLVFHVMPFDDVIHVFSIIYFRFIQYYITLTLSGLKTRVDKLHNL